MKKLILFYTILSISAISSAQKGTPFITHFNDGKEIEVENWAICQDSTNVMLFANRRGLLKYDGYRWEINHLPFAPTEIKRSKRDGIIYMGANNNYGYLRANPDGNFEYYSLSGDSTELGIITEIIFTDTTTIFYSDYSISVHRNDEPSDFRRWFAEEGTFFTGMIAHRNKLFFNLSGKGLYRIDDGELFPLVSGYITENREILFTIPWDAERILVGTDDNKLRLFDRIIYKDFDIENNEYLDENILSDGICISDSLLALSTLYGGVMVIKRFSGKEISILNYQNGLPDDEIYAIGRDNNEGLWMTHGYGICRVDFSLPVMNYSNYPGIDGTITAVLNHNNLFVGTNEGLYFLDEIRSYDKREVLYKKPPSKIDETLPTETEEKEEVALTEEKKPVKRFLNRLFRKKEQDNIGDTEAVADEKAEPEAVADEKPQYVKRTVSTLKSINYRYRKIEGMDYKCKQLVPAGEGILVVSNSGLYYTEGDNAEQLSANRFINRVVQVNEDSWIICAENGLYPLSISDGNWFVGKILAGMDMACNSAVIADPGTIWIGANNNVFRLSGSWDERSFELRQFPFIADFEVSYDLSLVNDTLFAFSENGISYFIQGPETFEAYVNPELGLVAKVKARYQFSQTDMPMIRTGDHWRLMNNDIEARQELESLIRLFDEPGMLSIDDAGNYWICNRATQIYRINKITSSEKKREFSMFISRVSTEEEDFFDLENLEFEPDQRLITVNMRAPHYLKETSTRYQYMIDDLMRSWSTWSTSPDIVLGLESGDYTVRLRAMNILGNISEEKVVSFSIKPPFTKSVLFYILIGLVVSALVILVFYVRTQKLRHDKKVLEQKVKERTVEIEKKKEQIEEQRDEIMKQKEEITASITYASRIQSALLPDKQLFKDVFRDHFIMFKPRDIVSGDFFWIAGNKNSIYFAASDCTGHGVPGAFMSMLGISLLNEITSDGEKDLGANEILELLRIKVMTSLSHSSTDDQAVDGMDIAFCKFDRKSKILEYAGAYNPLYHFRKGKLTEYKADRMPVGYHIAAKSFINKVIELKPGDAIYIFSDGFPDQFGGPDNKKFSSRRLKSALSEITELPMDKQLENLERRFQLWKGKREQIDDVIVLGIRF